MMMVCQVHHQGGLLVSGCLQHQGDLGWLVHGADHGKMVCGLSPLHRMLVLQLQWMLQG